MKTEAWAQDAAANHGLGSCLPSYVVRRARCRCRCWWCYSPLIPAVYRRPHDR
jgi:hypothetical protein